QTSAGYPAPVLSARPLPEAAKTTTIPYSGDSLSRLDLGRLDVPAGGAQSLPNCLSGRMIRQCIERVSPLQTGSTAYLRNCFPIRQAEKRETRPPDHRESPASAPTATADNTPGYATTAGSARASR